MKIFHKLFRRQKRTYTVRTPQIQGNEICRKMTLLHNSDIWILPTGVKFNVPLYPWDAIQKIIVNDHRFFEQDILDGLKTYIPNNAVILDIGANIGNHALFWACFMKARKIHAFEPIQQTYQILCKNIEINGLENIIVPHNVALGDKKASGEISMAYADNIGGTSIQESSLESDYSLKIERLDDMNLGEERIDFCKIDTEGFELKTLAGAKKTLQKYRPIVFIETLEEGREYKMPKGFGNNAPRVRAFFQELGYRDGIFFPPYNWLFIPKNEKK